MSAATLRTAASIARTDVSWAAYGQRVTGEHVAAHLDAARERVAKVGWHSHGMTTNLFGQLTAAAERGRGSASTRFVAGLVILAVLRARTGASIASHEVWERQEGRTRDDVQQLLLDAAAVARDAGPKEGS
ncbi:DUF6197 family protein [Streptomyces xiamenensis]|uniref:DUF6197 family protein n=1 Tax=Streptomyces xiamenensis TaxID=408015 RepID=UPI003D75CC43